MTGPRYDRRTLVVALKTLEAHDGLTVLTLRQDGLSGLWAQAPNVVQRWLTIVAREAVEGKPPDLGVFPGLALTAETPQDDSRWKLLRYAVSSFRELGSMGLAILGAPPGTSPEAIRVTALQVISDGRAPHVRVNAAICGVLWAWPRPGWLDTGLELLAKERDEASHVTVIAGHSEGRPAYLVYWNMDPSVIRVDSPQGLLRKMNRSIGPRGARLRWQQLRPVIDAEDLRSAFWEAVRAGVHPEERGTFMLEVIDRLHGAGQPSRRSSARVFTMDLEPLAAPSPRPEQEVERELDEETAHAELEAIRAIATPDEKHLLDALQAALEANRTATLADVARNQGWDYADLRAVLKRLRRKVKKQT